MRFVTLNQIPVSDLLAMADGKLENTITDLDFLETLAFQKCILVPPHVVQTAPSGQLTRVTPLVYTIDGELDKPRVLLAVARHLHAARPAHPFNLRFSL